MLDTMKATAKRTAAVAALAGLFLVAFVSAPANAQGDPDPAKTAIDGLGTKVTTYGGAVLAVVVLSVGIFLGAKYLRKALSKA